MPPNNDNVNILKLPFRRSTHLSLSTTIRRYINEKYDQHPDMFKKDLEIIDQLRRDAVNVQEPHQSGILKLTSYAAQLVWIGGKFPIDIGAEFTWYPALGYNTEHPLVVNNLRYELMNILYNLAALYAQLGINTPRGNTDGLKTAANYFSLAAGVLAHVEAEVLPELRMSTPPEDMDSHTLECLKQLMLAQSQECFWQKAVMDGYKDASIAKLAARVSDLYNLAGEAAVQSEAVSSAWIHHMTAKHHHFAAAAQYRAACDCLEKRKFGEEVARLTDAVACVNEGLKTARGGFLTKVVVDDLHGLKKKTEGDLKRAEKDNDIIYLQPVPPKSELKILERANMAVARTPKQVSEPYEFLGEQAEFGPALFSRLVPFSVHMAISIYEERRDRTVNQHIIQPLEQMTDLLHEGLTRLGLPGSLQSLEKPVGLPQSLGQHAEEVRQDNALERLRRSIDDITKLRASSVAMMEEARQSLAAEQEEDERMRRKYGTMRWNRPENKDITQWQEASRLITETDHHLDIGLNSDNTIKDKFVEIEDRLAILSGSDRGLMDYVPSSRRSESGEDLKTVVGRLRSAYNDILRVESRRRKKVQTLRDSSKSDDIKPDILKEAARLERAYPTTSIVPAHFETFFEKRLDALYEGDIDALEEEQSQQDKLLEQVERVNREFESQKRNRTDKSAREREAALQRLDYAYTQYKSIMGHLEQARKYYNDLNKIVGAGLRDPVRAWVAGRRKEAQRMEEELNMPSLSNLNISQQAPHFASQPQHQSSQSSIQSWATDSTAPDHMQQPQPVAPPQGMWNPNAGIRFGAQNQPQQGQAKQPQDKTWNPNSGIRFG